MPAWAEALALGEGDQAGWLTQRLHLVRREMGSVSAHTQKHPPLWQREGWMWCGRTDLLVLGHATDLPWAPKRGPVTLSFSPKTPLLSKAWPHYRDCRQRQELARQAQAYANVLKCLDFHLFQRSHRICPHNAWQLVLYSPYYSAHSQWKSNSAGRES